MLGSNMGHTRKNTYRYSLTGVAPLLILRGLQICDKNFNAPRCIKIFAEKMWRNSDERADQKYGAYVKLLQMKKLGGVLLGGDGEISE